MSMLAAPPAASKLIAQLAVAPDAETREVRAPFTGEILYRLPLATEYDVASAAARARSVQREWAERPVRDRVRIMRRFHDLVIAKRDEALDLLQWEVGKARADALEEVLDVAVVAQYYTRKAPGLLKSRRVRGALPLLVGVEEIRKPVGLVGIIAPWNYPLTLAASDAIPALLAGNGVLLKPDPQTTLISAWVLEQLLLAGLPDGLMAILPGEGPVAGPMVIDTVDHVMFTGSTATGRVVAERCAKRLIECTLELGGKNAMIVRADVDPAKAAETAVRACFANAGQLCISMERIYVNAAVYDAFLAHFIPRVLSMRIASGPGWDGDIGCLISPAHLDRVRSHVEDAVAQG
ncbi:MAG: aldehyde dehydrogenase family protein, partial [Candidatus Nanopelagicales bacterium]